MIESKTTDFARSISQLNLISKVQLDAIKKRIGTLGIKANVKNHHTFLANHEFVISTSKSNSAKYTKNKRAFQFHLDKLNNLLLTERHYFTLKHLLNQETNSNIFSILTVLEHFLFDIPKIAPSLTYEPPKFMSS